MTALCQPSASSVNLTLLMSMCMSEVTTAPFARLPPKSEVSRKGTSPDPKGDESAPTSCCMRVEDVGFASASGTPKKPERERTRRPVRFTCTPRLLKRRRPRSNSKRLSSGRKPMR